MRCSIAIVLAICALSLDFASAQNAYKAGKKDGVWNYYERSWKSRNQGLPR